MNQQDIYLVEEKDNPAVCRLDYDMGLKSWYAPEVGQWRSIAALPAESKLLLVVFINRIEKKITCQINRRVLSYQRMYYFK